MQKTKLPWDVKQTCIWIVRGYERRVKWYQEERKEILSGSGTRYDTYEDERTGESIRQFLPKTAAGRATEQKTLRLERLERDPEILRMRAVEYAARQVCPDIQNQELRQRLVGCIRQNCQNGRAYPFEYLNLTEFSRSDFYRRKDQFLYWIASFLKLV
ncbi:MAG: hypothetical protein PHT34_05110 [Oscillospiraceae bacterium]|nr:hypothetical protein [Oscillospiraceae bacterium]